MKTISILIAFILLSSFNILNKPGKTIYYFCFSQSRCPENLTMKQIVLFTSIYEITDEEKIISLKASEWAFTAYKNCENENGCTSDLTYYYSKEAADRNLALMKKDYSDTNKYFVKLVDFK